MLMAIRSIQFGLLVNGLDFPDLHACPNALNSIHFRVGSPGCGLWDIKPHHTNLHLARKCGSVFSVFFCGPAKV